MKKYMKTLASLAVAFSLVACNTPAAPSTETTAEATKVGGTLVVDTQVFKGNFFTSGFGNTSEDALVKELLHLKAGTTYTSMAGEIKLNPTYAKELKEELDADGNKIYTITIQEGLKFSDGSPLTAKDYVFGTLFTMSDEFASVGASITSDDSVIGEDAYKAGIKFENYDDYLAETKEASATLSKAEEGSAEYNAALEVVKAAKEKYGEAAGENGAFKGLKLVDDLTFSITIKAEKLPYFYELVNIGLVPYSMATLAPGADIASDENGASVVGVDLEEAAKNVVAEGGYLKKPTVVAGPYTLESFENNEVVLKVNPNYAGDEEGRKPTIETIILKGNTNSDLVGERFLNKEVDLISNIFQSNVVSKLEEAGAVSNKYDRLGYGYLAMGFNAGPTADVHVRKAIAHMLDRQGLISSFLGAGNGIIVNSQYATAQWMYLENKEALSELNAYDYSVDKANEELDQSAYKFQADGTTPWEAGSGNRYNAEGEELVIRHFGTENNPVTDYLKSNLALNAEKVGMKYEVDLGDWNALIDQYYYWSKKPVAERYHLFNLATTFTAAYDPYLNDHSRNAGTTTNPMSLEDSVLDELAEKMRQLDKGQREEFSKYWLEYQQRYNDILPLVPLYSNVYRDYYNTDKIESVPTTSFRRWSTIIEQIKLK